MSLADEIIRVRDSLPEVVPPMSESDGRVLFALCCGIAPQLPGLDVDAPVPVDHFDWSRLRAESQVAMEAMTFTPVEVVALGQRLGMLMVGAVSPLDVYAQGMGYGIARGLVTERADGTGYIVTV